MSERRIFTSYTDHMRYPQTERDMILRLQASEGAGSGEGFIQQFLNVCAVLSVRARLRTYLFPKL